MPTLSTPKTLSGSTIASYEIVLTAIPSKGMAKISTHFSDGSDPPKPLRIETASQSAADQAALLNTHANAGETLGQLIERACDAWVVSANGLDK